MLETHFGEDILGYYVENLEEFKNNKRSEDKNKFRYEEFNKCMEYILTVNLDQS